MLASLANALQAGEGPVALVGSDCPGLTAGLVGRLLGLRSDVALGPSSDGGFWGVAVRRIHPAMFDGVVWSQADVFRRTAAACRRAGLTVTRGPLLDDTDEPGDLARLYRYQRESCPAPVYHWLRRRFKCIKLIHF